MGIFTWYDSISRVGASKEVLLAEPLEVTFIVILAYIFLGEKLDRVYLTGVVVAIVGFFLGNTFDSLDSTRLALKMFCTIRKD